MKIKGEIKNILHITTEFAIAVKESFITGIEDIKNSENIKDGLQTGVIIFLQNIFVLCCSGLFVIWLVGYLGLILVHILFKSLSQLYKFIRRLWEKAHSFMPLPPHALGAVGNCITNIFIQHPSDFPVAGHNDGGTAPLMAASIEQRPGFNYLQFNVVKQNAS